MPSHSRNTSSGSNRGSLASDCSSTLGRTSFQVQKDFLLETLSATWGGEDWLPADVRSRCHSPSFGVLQCIDKATTMAQSRNTQLAFLWGPKGPLRIAFDSSSQNLSNDFCTLADQLVSDWARISSLAPPPEEQESDKQLQRIVDQIFPNENVSGTLSTGLQQENEKEVTKRGCKQQLLPGELLKPLIAGDLPLRVQQDIDTVRQLLIDAYGRKANAEWAIKATETLLQEVNDLFHHDDEVMGDADAGLRPGEDSSTQTQRCLLEGDIRREKKRVEQADSDIQKYESDIRLWMRIIQNFNDACVPLPGLPSMKE